MGKEAPVLVFNSPREATRFALLPGSQRTLKAIAESEARGTNRKADKARKRRLKQDFQGQGNIAQEIQFQIDRAYQRLLSGTAVPEHFDLIKKFGSTYFKETNVSKRGSEITVELVNFPSGIFTKSKRKEAKTA